MKKSNIKEIILGAITIAVVAGIVYVTPFVLGKWNNKVDKAIGVESASVQREKFKENKSYVEGMISDLGKYKREYEKATEDEKKGITIFIQDEFANFDAELIDNDSLYSFLIDIRSGNLN